MRTTRWVSSIPHSLHRSGAQTGIPACLETHLSSFPLTGSDRRFPAMPGDSAFRTSMDSRLLQLCRASRRVSSSPQVSGAGATPAAPSGVFRIDHDEKFNQTIHLQYQIGKTGRWVGFNWRYDSGMVAGAVPFAPATDPTGNIDLTGLSADQQFQAGLFCGSQRAMPTSALSSCSPALFGSSLISIPAPGTENDDKNPPRIKPRSLFDISVGDDNLFNGDRYKWSLQLTAIDFTNKEARYNFLNIQRYALCDATRPYGSTRISLLTSVRVILARLYTRSQQKIS